MVHFFKRFNVQNLGLNEYRAELGQYFCANAQFTKKSAKDLIGVEPPNSPLGTTI